MREAGLTRDVDPHLRRRSARPAASPYREMLDVAEAADLLLNITGHLTLEPLMRRLRRKAYLDLDPGFTQFWHAAGHDGARLNGHDFHFTIGENIGTPECGIPTGDIRWRHTRQPASSRPTPVWSRRGPGRFTTIASWRGPYGPVQHGSTTFGLKVHEFRKLIDLPQRASAEFEIALDIHPADERDLRPASRSRVAGRRPARVSCPIRARSTTTFSVRTPNARPRRASTSRPTAAGSAIAPCGISPRESRRSCRTPASAAPTPSARA